MSHINQNPVVFSELEPITTLELKSLDRSLKLARGFKLYFVVFPATEGDFHEAFLNQMESELVFLPLKGPTKNLIKILETTEKRSLPLAVLGLSQTLDNPRFAKKMLTSLNIGRDFLPKIMQVPLLLVIEPQHVKLFSKQAPDFFSVRSGLFSFERGNPLQIASMTINSHIKKLTYTKSKTELPMTWPEFQPHFKKFHRFVNKSQMPEALAYYFTNIEHSEGFLTRVLGKHDANIQLLKKITSLSPRQITGTVDKSFFAILTMKAIQSLLAVGESVAASKVMGSLVHPKALAEDFSVAIAEPLSDVLSSMVAQGVPLKDSQLVSIGLTDDAKAKMSASLAYRSFLEGDVQGAESDFQLAEQQMQTHQGNASFLAGMAGFYYGELLWFLRRYDSVERRARQALVDAEKKSFLLEMGLAQLHLGRVVAVAGKGQNIQNASSLLTRALENLKQSQYKFFIIHGLLDMARFLSKTGDRSKAADLAEEAMKLAEVYPFLLVDAAGLLSQMNPDAITTEKLKLVREIAKEVKYQRGLELLEAL